MTPVKRPKKTLGNVGMYPERGASRVGASPQEDKAPRHLSPLRLWCGEADHCGPPSSFKELGSATMHRLVVYPYGAQITRTWSIAAPGVTPLIPNAVTSGPNYVLFPPFIRFCAPPPSPVNAHEGVLPCPMLELHHLRGKGGVDWVQGIQL